MANLPALDAGPSRLRPLDASDRPAAFSAADSATLPDPAPTRAYRARVDRRESTTLLAPASWLLCYT